MHLGYSLSDKMKQHGTPISKWKMLNHMIHNPTKQTNSSYFLLINADKPYLWICETSFIYHLIKFVAPEYTLFWKISCKSCSALTCLGIP